MPPRLDATQLIGALERARIPGPCGIAFDADGTLWSGDVGEDVYDHACEQDLFRPEADAEVRRLARRYALPGEGPLAGVAAALYGAYRRDVIPTEVVCELMTWIYAGWTEEDLRGLARGVLTERSVPARVRAGVAAVHAWASRTAVRTIVVSASPRLIVEEALELAGLRVSEVVGSRAAVDAGRIAPRMAEALPFAGQKVTAGMRALAGHDWLASFGDNFFDADMLRAARVGVAVDPKPALAAHLHDLPNTVVLV